MKLSRRLVITLSAVILLSSLSFTALARGTDKTQWYYDQLSTEGKTIYNALLETTNNVKSKATLSSSREPNKDAMREAFTAFSYEQPEKFWFNGWSIAINSHNGEVDTLMYPMVTPDYGTPNPQAGTPSKLDTQAIKAQKKKVQDKARTIVDAAKGSDYERVLYFNNWLVENCEYVENADAGEQSDKTPYTMIGALLEKKAVCQGYSLAFKYLCDLADIPCIFVPGEAISPSSASFISHAWNYVRLGNAWYLVDSTWNDPVGIATPESRTDYFLVGSDTVVEGEKISASYREDATYFDFPTLSKTAYGAGKKQASSGDAAMKKAS